MFAFLSVTLYKVLSELSFFHFNLSSILISVCSSSVHWCSCCYLTELNRVPRVCVLHILCALAKTVVLLHPQRSSDGSLSQEEESSSGPVFGKVGELQEVVERQMADLGQMKERMASMVSRINELEEDLDTARKDLIKSEDMNTRLQRDLREVGGGGASVCYHNMSKCVP